MFPFPGTGIAADVAFILGAMVKIRTDFNLTEARMDKFADLMPGAVPLINTVVRFVSTEGARLLLKEVAGGAIVAEATKY
jgi:hypothetical protein